MRILLPGRTARLGRVLFAPWRNWNARRCAVSFLKGVAEVERGPVSTKSWLSLKIFWYMTHKITLLPGDGIGPEVADAARQVIEAAGVPVEWEVISAPLEGGKRPGEFPRAQAVKSVRRNHVALKGPMATGIAQGPPSINVALRKELDLYANLRPVRNLNGVA